MYDFTTIFSAIAAGGSCVTALLTYSYNKNKDQKNHAEKVVAWIDDIYPDKSEVCIAIANNSFLPIYDFFVIGCPNRYNLLTINAWNKYYNYNEIIIPGLKRIQMKSSPPSCGGVHFSINIFFRDASGQEWFRDNKGILKKCNNYKNLLRERKIYEPYG